MKKVLEIESTNKSELLDQISELLDQKLNQANQQTKPDDELLTRKQTADLLKITLPTLWAWTNKDILPAYRIGNKIRYKKSEVLKALNQINKAKKEQ